MMLRAALVVMAALVAAPAFADDDPALLWRDCSVDADCVAIQGACNLTAVNIGYKDDAVEFYRKLHAEANCVKKFWEPKSVVPECKPLAGSEPERAAHDQSHPGPSQYGAVMKHGTCAMVPKPNK